MWHIAQAMVASLELGCPVFLQVGARRFIEVDGAMALANAAGTGECSSLPTNGY